MLLLLLPPLLLPLLFLLLLLQLLVRRSGAELLRLRQHQGAHLGLCLLLLVCRGA